MEEILDQLIALVPYPNKWEFLNKKYDINLNDEEKKLVEEHTIDGKIDTNFFCRNYEQCHRGVHTVDYVKFIYKCNFPFPPRNSVVDFLHMFVETDNIDGVKYMASVHKTYHSAPALTLAIKKRNFEMIKVFESFSFHNRRIDCESLRKIVKDNDMEMLRFLVENNLLSVTNETVFNEIVRRDNTEMMNYMLKCVKDKELRLNRNVVNTVLRFRTRKLTRKIMVEKYMDVISYRDYDYFFTKCVRNNDVETAAVFSVKKNCGIQNLTMEQVSNLVKNLCRAVTGVAEDDYKSRQDTQKKYIRKYYKGKKEAIDSKSREVPKEENKEQEVPKEENKEQEVPKEENKEQDVTK